MVQTRLLTQWEFQQILLSTITKVQDNEKIRVTELIEEIKQQIILKKNQM